jgi:mycothiol synthase
MTTTASPPPPVAPGSGIDYRRWTGLDELPGMAAANARLRAHVGLLEPIDLESIRHRYTHLTNSDPATDCIIAERDGTTVGYARTEWHDLTDGDRLFDMTCVVEPDAWGLGIADAFVSWCEGRLRETASAMPRDRRSWFGTSVFDGDAELEATLLARGYEAVRWDAEMLRETMDDLPDVPPLPDGYAIRPVRDEDMPRVYEAVVESFREHWGEYDEGEDGFRDWIDDPLFELGLVTVVWRGDRPAACVSSQVQAGPDGLPRAYVDGVSTHPDHRRLGLARAALADNLQRLRERGVQSAYLGVDTDNHNRAFALYEDAGFRKVTGSASYRKPFEGQETRP